MMIITFNDTYPTVIEMLNTFSMEIRDILHIPLDLHVHTVSTITKGNTYYDPSFLSHLITDCPPSVKRGEPSENIIPIDANWTAKEAMNARMRIAKLDLARLQAGLTYHKEKLDGYFL
ncbi:MAG: hypothetical protein LBG52_05565 [Candidatus Peribacteria bacterium]|jgi:hypothetical protein|nr:hypothetical protein [Candidatus Peribacteria bacterium]